MQPRTSTVDGPTAGGRVRPGAAAGTRRRRRRLGRRRGPTGRHTNRCHPLRRRRRRARDGRPRRGRTVRRTGPPVRSGSGAAMQGASPHSVTPQRMRGMHERGMHELQHVQRMRPASAHARTQQYMQRTINLSGAQKRSRAPPRSSSTCASEHLHAGAGTATCWPAADRLCLQQAAQARESLLRDVSHSVTTTALESTCVYSAAEPCGANSRAVFCRPR